MARPRPTTPFPGTSGPVRNQWVENPTLLPGKLRYFQTRGPTGSESTKSLLWWYRRSTTAGPNR